MRGLRFGPRLPWPATDEMARELVCQPREGDPGERRWRDCRPTDGGSHHLVNSIGREEQRVLTVLLETRF